VYFVSGVYDYPFIDKSCQYSLCRFFVQASADLENIKKVRQETFAA
jgi:protein-disulfide isomerase